MLFHLNQFHSETKIKKILKHLIFGHNLKCPRCGTRQVKASARRYWCQRCRVHFSLLSHTYLKASKLSLRVLWAVLWCYCKKVPVQLASELTKVSENGIRRHYDLFRAQIPDAYGILKHQVQLDEAFFFGKKGKALMLGKQVGTRDLAFAVYETQNLGKNEATSFLYQNVAPRTRLQTDGGGIYRGIDQWWPVCHKKDIHSKWEFELTSEIEGMFGVFRTFIRRMYHHVTKEKFEEYVREFCVRFSSPQLFSSPSQFLEKTIKPVPFD